MPEKNVISEKEAWQHYNDFLDDLPDDETFEEFKEEMELFGIIVEEEN